MRRRWFLAGLFLAAAGSASPLAAQTIIILDVGLQGELRARDAVARVLVEVTNTQAQARELELRLSTFDSIQGSESEPVHFHFRLAAGERRTLELPLLIRDLHRYGPRALQLIVTLLEGKGAALGRKAAPLRPSGGDQTIAVALLCARQEHCKEIQSSLVYSGAIEEQAAKSQTLRFVLVQQLPFHAWAFEPAGVVILARPLAGLLPEQSAALEEFVRIGNRMILIEPLLGDAEFLAPYRRGKPAGAEQRVGRGSLVRLAELDGRKLGARFPTLSSVTRSEELGSLPWLGISHVRWRLGTKFEFPTFGWLLAWLAAYVLLVGPVNFLALHRLGRREWGWATVPLISLLFATTLYFLGAARRPASVTVDEFAVEWLDDRVPQCSRSAQVRVSTPRRAKLQLRVPGQPILGELSVWQPGGRIENLHFYLGKEVRFDAPLKTWSYKDLIFSDSCRLPGGVTRQDEWTLVNSTGHAFEQALYADENALYYLGPVADGAKVDLRSAPVRHFRIPAGGKPRASPAPVPQVVLRAERALREEKYDELSLLPFALSELYVPWREKRGADGRVPAVFMGLKQSESLRLAVEQEPFARKHYVVTAVVFTEAP
jgi:hypothetical protein